MTRDDRRRGSEWPIQDEQSSIAHRTESESTMVRRSSRSISPVLLALAGLLALLFLLWFFSGNRNPDQDKLTDPASEQAKAADPEKRCASKATYEMIKRELFRQAAQVRGSDQSAFDRLAGYATLRMENPVLESDPSDDRVASCSGSASLDLPPGVAVVGGRRSLTANIDYSLQPAADGSGDVLLLRNADSIVTPLATLAKVAQPAQAAAPVDTNSVEQDDPLAPQPATPVVETPSAPPRPTGARPSYDCADARTRGEQAVCADAGLATLDRQMAAQFNRSLGIADEEQRALLQRTRTRFLSYRDSCRSNGCIADAYRGRMREISDIMAGRWEPR